MKLNIALLRGDGIGPEIVDSAVAVLEKIAEKDCEFKITGHEIIFEGICPDCAVNNN